MDPTETRSMMRQGGLFALAGFEFAAAVFAGYWVGSWADLQLNTRPWLMAAGVLLGFSGVCWSLFVTLRKLGAFNSDTGDDSDDDDAED